VLEPGSNFAGYRIDAFLRRTPVSDVYRATQVALDRSVFLLVVGPELAHDATFRSRFEKSAQIAASLKHPNVVPVHEMGEERNHLFLSSTYINGQSIGELLAHSGGLSPRRAAVLVAQVADGLEAAHARGLVHGHITPASVLVESFGDHDHAYLSGLGMPQLGAVSTADDVDALAGVFAPCISDRAEPDLAAVLSRSHQSAAALGRAALHVTRTAEVPTRRRYRLLVAFAIALSAVAAAGVLAFKIVRGGSDPTGSRLAGVASKPIFVGDKPFDFAVGDSTVWVIREGKDPLVRIDTGRNELVGLPVSVRRPPGTVAFGRDGLFLTQFDGKLVLTDPVTGEEMGEALRVGKGDPVALTADRRGAWVSLFSDDPTVDPAVVRLDPLEGRRLSPRIKVDGFPSEIVVSNGAAWVLQSEALGFVTRIDPATNEVVTKIAVGGYPTGLASGGGAVWVANSTVGTVMRIDPATNAIAWTGGVPGVHDVAFIGDSLWALSETMVRRLDPSSGLTLGDPIVLSSPGNAMEAGEGALWILSYDAGTVTRIDPSRDAPNPAPGQTPKQSPPSLPAEGPLRAGRYETNVFEVPLEFAVGTGWTLASGEIPTAFVLNLSFDPRSSLGFLSAREVFLPAGNETRPAPRDLARWLENHPHLVIRRKREVTIAGRAGVALDVAVRSTPKPNPPECGRTQCVMLFKMAENFELFLAEARAPERTEPPPAVDRFVFVDLGDRMLTITYGTLGTEREFRDFARKVDRILTTLEFR
jgi:streptogramin lyase